MVAEGISGTRDQYDWLDNIHDWHKWRLKHKWRCSGESCRVRRHVRRTIPVTNQSSLRAHEKSKQVHTSFFEALSYYRRFTIYNNCVKQIVSGRRASLSYRSNAWHYYFSTTTKKKITKSNTVHNGTWHYTTNSTTTNSFVYCQTIYNYIQFTKGI